MLQCVRVSFVVAIVAAYHHLQVANLAYTVNIDVSPPFWSCWRKGWNAKLVEPWKGGKTLQLSWKNVPPKHPTNGMTWIKLFKNQINSNMQGAKESACNTVLKFPNSILKPHRMACLLCQAIHGQSIRRTSWFCKSKLRSCADGRTSPGWFVDFVVDLLNYVWTKLCFKLPNKNKPHPQLAQFFQLCHDLLASTWLTAHIITQFFQPVVWGIDPVKQQLGCLNQIDTKLMRYLALSYP